MTTIFDSACVVKTTRTLFAAGVAPARPARFVPSAADRRFAAETSPYNDFDFDVLGPSDAVIEEAALMAAERAAFDAGLYF